MSARRVARIRLPGAAIGFLLPNLLGFLIFTLFPVLFSFWMAFTNWTPKPAVKVGWLGLRNFSDLLGVRALGQPHPIAAWLYALCAFAACAALVGCLWATMEGWRGTRLGGAVVAALGLALLWGGLSSGIQGVWLAGAALGICGAAMNRREGPAWAAGRGAVFPLALTAAIAGIWLLGPAMWRWYEPRDARFWQYLYNTLYLMIGIPFAIGGSLLLALLLNEDMPFGAFRLQALGAVGCLAAGAASGAALWSVGYPDAGVLAAILWTVAALGIAFNVVAFRTLFYLPTFTAGVALMILWKALYNPETGPINEALRTVFAALRLHARPPEWLASVDWAKPALIAMGVWIGIGGTNMLLYLAGLSNVPRELLDAAEVDGAGNWHRFWHVTWPQLAPTTFFITIMSIIGGLQGGFEQARVMTAGGPAGSTTTLSYYIYNKAFQDLDLGYAAAISWVLFAIVFIATALNWRFGRGLEVE